jgi:hypothetical protein
MAEIKFIINLGGVVDDIGKESVMFVGFHYQAVLAVWVTCQRPCHS